VSPYWMTFSPIHGGPHKIHLLSVCVISDALCESFYIQPLSRSVVMISVPHK
jgi:hypothetical protein